MEFEMGSIYRVDHSKLPQSTTLPRSLKSIKVVLVNHKSDEYVTVVFPSNQSLRNYFGYSKKENGVMQPILDEHYVMGVNLGKKLLTQKVSFEEFAVKRGKRSFWVDCDEDDDDDDHNGDYDDDHHRDQGFVVRWEKRKRTMYGKKRKVDYNKKKMRVSTVKEDALIEVEKKEDEKEIAENTRTLKKRKCPFKGVKYREKKKIKQTIKEVSEKKFEDAQHRWTTERYKLAEKNILKILKEMEAGPRNPILRSVLRIEARKLIGDTGLLDHLLKHMAGKLAPGGKERFRRRHNPDGAMEYWLESADLIETRKKVGVGDPYWVPPPGWKPGDCLNQDPVCAMQLKELKEEVSDMKRVFKKLAGRGNVKNQALNEESLTPLQTLHDELIQKKAQIEKQLLDLSKEYSEMEEDIARLKESVAEENELMADFIGDEDKGKHSAEINKAEKISEGKENEIRLKSPKPSQTVEETKESRRQKLKSGFRICKPQGTFLWPSQMCSPSSSSTQIVVHLEDLLGYSGPPSSSSASSSSLPSILSPQPPCHLHQEPPATVKKPVAIKAAVTLNFSIASIRGATTIDSITTTTTAGCSSDAHSYVPDLNEVPLPLLI